METKKIKVSALNLIPKFQGDTTIGAIDRGVELAKILERMGYYRYWIAEHHNFKGVVSSATALLIQRVLADTEKIEVGAGGVMLPNHSPLQVAEVYGTLETMYPERVNLGIGRAPGTDMETAALIYRQQYARTENFIKDIRSLQRFFGPEELQGKVAAYPGVGTNVPIFILGSSLNSAYVAAELGLPYSFAGHFSPELGEEAVGIYRRYFKPSKHLLEPYVILGVLAHGAENDREAERLYTSVQQGMLRLARGETGAYPLPDKDFEENMEITSAEKIFLKSKMGINLMGTGNTMMKKWIEVKNKYNPDEVIAVSYMPELEQLETSYKILKEVVEERI